MAAASRMESNEMTHDRRAFGERKYINTRYAV
jgi:hypothetical protein